MNPYRDFFKAATGNEPYPYQERVAQSFPSMLEIPTGLGKTEATVVAWAYHRQTMSAKTPRRLIYCLPMRTLVEQTRDRISDMRERLRMKGIDAIPEPETLMGGDVDDKWFRTPEVPAIIIGTQDILLS
jgi:CRISPR-associated endonuclease/helicase Cas3